jgi:hypothetical protein
MPVSYAVISALIFAFVAFVHLARLLKSWPVQVGSHSVPMSVSWVGLLVSALLAIWGFIQVGH